MKKNAQYPTTILNDKTLIVFLLRSGTRQGYPLLPLQFSLILEVLTSAIREEKEIKGRQIGKAGVIVFIENPCNPQKLLELITEFSSVIGYKVDPQKPTAVLYTHSEQLETKI